MTFYAFSQAVNSNSRSKQRNDMVELSKHRRRLPRIVNWGLAFMSSVQFSSGMLQVIPVAPENKSMEHPIQVDAVKKTKIAVQHGILWYFN